MPGTGAPTSSSIATNLEVSNPALLSLGDGSLVLFGGSESTDHSMLPATYLYGQIPPDGGAVEFVAAGELASGHDYPTLIATPTTVYVLGGRLPDGGIAPDEKLVHADGGALVDALVGQLLVVPRFGAASVIVQNYAYVLGGATGDGGLLAEVEAAQVQSDGTLGPFQVLGQLEDSTGTATPRVAASALVRSAGTSPQIVVVGGADSYALAGLAGGPTTVLGFNVLPSHDLSEGQTLGSLSHSHVDGAAYLDDATQTLYEMGGAPSIDNVYFALGGPSADVEALSALPDGGFGEEVDYSSLLPDAREGFVVAPICRDLYLVGGETWNGSADNTQTMATTIDVIHLP